MCTLSRQARSADPSSRALRVAPMHTHQKVPADDQCLRTAMNQLAAQVPQSCDRILERVYRLRNIKYVSDEMMTQTSRLHVLKETLLEEALETHLLTQSIA